MDEKIIHILCKMEREPSLQKLIDLAFELLGNPMFFQDIELNIPYYTRCVEIREEPWQRNVVNGEFCAERIMQRMGPQQIRELAQERRPVELPPNPLHNNGRINYAFPLATGNVFHGVLILASIFRPLQPEDKLLFQLFGEIFYAQLTHNFSLGVSNISLNAQLVIMLLNGEEVGPAYMETMLSHMQWKPLKYRRVVLICARESTDGAESLSQVVDLLSQPGKNCLVRYQDSLVYVCTSDQPCFSLAEEVPALEPLLERNGLCAGVSRPFLNLRALRQFYVQALHAVEIGELMEPGNNVYSFETLAFYCLAEQWRRQYAPEDLLDFGIVEIWRRDQQGAQLIPTLNMYLDCGMDATLAAERLYVHKNTVRYRIQRCEEIMGRALTDGETAFQAKMSLKMLEYIQKSGLHSGFLTDADFPY